MLTPEYSNPSLIDPGDLDGALHEFLARFALPLVPKEHIFAGWENRVSAPPASGNEYIVFSVLHDSQLGTNNIIENNGPDVGDDFYREEHALFQVGYQIDFCSSKAILAKQRARSVKILAKSEVSASFFKQYNIFPAYAEDVRHLPFIGAEQESVKRAQIIWHFQFWSSVRVLSKWFDSVVCGRIENVDVHHKP